MKCRIGWLIPSLIEGSGGIREIFNKINALVDEGHECHAYVQQDINDRVLEETIAQFYGGCRANIHAGWEMDRSFDLLFATIWWSAKVVAQTTAKQAYLIQDFEAFFNPMGDGFLLAEESYQLGLAPITLGRWLPSLLRTRYGAQARFFDFCADTETYFPEPSSRREDPSVCFIHQPEKPRRCANIGLKALELLKKERPEVKVYLYGAKGVSEAAFDHVNLGILKPAQINSLYNKCTLGFCISSSNPSRIPFEMMAAGLPVVDIHRENNLFDFPEDGVLLAEATPHALKKALVALLDDEPRRREMGQFGAEFMKARPMSREYEQFLYATHKIIDGSFHRDPVPLTEPSYRKAAVKG